MPHKEIEITIGPGGEVEVHIKGIMGRIGCRNIAAVIAKAVGPIASISDTSEAYEPDEAVRIRQEQRN